MASPAQIIQSALFPGSNSGSTYEKTAKVLDTLGQHGWGFAKISDMDAVARELDTLRDLAHVLDAQIEEGAIIPDGMGLVIAALARAKPELIHTGERCKNPECLVHGPCDECPTEAQYRSLDALLTTWLAEHPREVVIHKTQSVGKTETRLDIIHPWQPAGAYPVDGTIIEVEGRPLHMRYCLDKTSHYNATHRLGGWLSAPAGDGGWRTTSTPTGRWRKAPPVKTAGVVTMGDGSAHPLTDAIIRHRQADPCANYDACKDRHHCVHPACLPAKSGA